MKIVKTASGKRQIKISRKEWESIGKKAGWIKISNQPIPPAPSLSKPKDVKAKPSDVKPIIDQLDKSVMPGAKDAFKGPGKQPITDLLSEMSNISDNPTDMNKVKGKLKSLDMKFDSKGVTR